MIILVTAASLFFLAGAFFPPFTAIGVIYILILSIYSLVDAAVLTRRRQIVLERTVPERLSLGSPARIIVNITNNSRRRVEIRIAEDLPEGMEADPSECRGVFDSGAVGALEYRLTARRRGRYDIHSMYVRVLPYLGLFYRQFRLDEPAVFEVFPNLVNLKEYELLLKKGMALEQGWAHLRRRGQGSEFESLRPYTEGDDLSLVEWKATAKRSQLIVKNFQPERQQSIFVLIDVGRATAGEFEGISRLDYFVNAALMLAYVALRQGDWFSLAAFSDRVESYLPPVRRLQNIEMVAGALHELRPRIVEADYGAVCRFVDMKNRKRSLICLMTDVIDRQASDIIIGYLARFARRHLPLAVTLNNPEIVELAEKPLFETGDLYSKAAALDVLTARKEALTVMRRLGVEVLDINPKALTPALINRYLLIKSTRRL